MKYLSYICLFIGIGLAIIWILQQVSSLNLLNNPETGAIIFLLVGFVIGTFAHRRK